MATLYGQLSNPKWGCTTEATMIVDASSLEGSVQTNELSDEVGEVVMLVTYGGKNEYDLTFTVKADSYPTAALKGSIFTATGNHADTYIVTSVNNTFEKEGWLNGSLKGVSYAEIDATATTTTSA